MAAAIDDPLSSPQRDGSMRADLISAYAAAIVRIGSWAIIAAVLYRHSTWAFAQVALVRGTLGILNYTALGVAPALIAARSRDNARDAVPRPGTEPAHSPPSCAQAATPQPIVLAYHPPEGHRLQLLASASVVAVIAAVAGLAVTAAYVYFSDVLVGFRDRDLRDLFEDLATFMGIGIVARLASDAAGAFLQLDGRIVTDNVILILGEVVWVVATILGISTFDQVMPTVGRAFLLASVLVLLLRYAMALNAAKAPLAFLAYASPACMWGLVRSGFTITVGQLADYLYAPTDYLLIGALLSSRAAADYSPAVQIDAGLFLLVAGLSAVLLPKSATAHAAGDRARVRLYYVRGTAAGLAALAAASAVVWFAAPLIFRLWLGDPMPQTQAILPLVLICTVLGGASTVGRSILLGTGHAKAFTIAVLVAGVVNVVCSYCFVKYLGWGLRGIVLGTVVATVGRCVFWMPWYVMRSLKPQPQNV